MKEHDLIFLSVPDGSSFGRNSQNECWWQLLIPFSKHWHWRCAQRSSLFLDLGLLVIWLSMQGDALKAETLALCHGLQLAWNNVVSNLCLESDNLQLVEIINSKVYLPFHLYDSLLLVILDYIEGRPSWS